DGRLTDSQGRTVNFTNTVILMTSNLGSEYIQPVETEEENRAMQSQIMEVVRGHFRPEFLNRLDDVLIFRQLGHEAMRPIVDIQLRRLVRRLEERNITLELTDEAREKLAAWGFNPLYGARPLRRVIQTRIQDALSEMFLRNEISENQTIKVDMSEEGDELIFDVV
ncbi:MAG: AAA family ATPase, partial [Methylococcus sp.]